MHEWWHPNGTQNIQNEQTAPETLRHEMPNIQPILRWSIFTDGSHEETAIMVQACPQRDSFSVKGLGLWDYGLGQMLQTQSGRATMKLLQDHNQRFQEPVCTTRSNVRVAEEKISI